MKTVCIALILLALSGCNRDTSARQAFSTVVDQCDPSGIVFQSKLGGDVAGFTLACAVRGVK